MRPKSLLFDREETIKRGEYELEHEHLYMEAPPNWFTKFFSGSSITSSNTYNMARVIAEFVVMRFEHKLIKWIDERIDARIRAHLEELHGDEESR
jgi:hypothetical protein